MTYDVESDIFKPYGFDSCSKWTVNTGATAGTKFLAYSHILDSTVVRDKTATYPVSLYFYVSLDCNVNFSLVLKHDNSWVSTYKGTALNINDSTKGKVACYAQTKYNRWVNLYHVLS